MAAPGRLSLAVPVLPCRDLNGSVAFYARLGFEVESLYPDYAILRGPGGELHLAVEAVDPAANPAGLYLRVTDADVWARAFGQAAEDKPWGQREFAMSGPDGELLRVGSAPARGPLRALLRFGAACRRALRRRPP